MDFRIVTGNSNKKNAISATINDEEDVTRNRECVTESKDNIAGSIFPSHISTTTHCIHVHTWLVPISKIITMHYASWRAVVSSVFTCQQLPLAFDD